MGRGAISGTLFPLEMVMPPWQSTLQKSQLSANVAARNTQGRERVPRAPGRALLEAPSAPNAFVWKIY